MGKKKVKNDNPIISLEKEAMEDSASETLNKKDLIGHESAKVDDEEQVIAQAFEKGAGEEAEISAEVAAVRTDNESAEDATRQTAKKTVKAKPKKIKKRSNRYMQLASLIDKEKSYKIDEAIELIKQTASEKFDGSIEVHIKLMDKRGKKQLADESKRGIIHLPHGLGKALKIVIMDEKKIDTIASTKKIDFDVAIAKPELMPKLAKVAKILGPKGKMPNPKMGTVSDEPEKVKEEISQGRVEYKVDLGNVIHQMIGKVSWDNDKIKENYQALLQTFISKNIQTVNLSSTMGPGIKIDWAS